MLFSGSFDHTIDEKGRINIPATFRSQLPASEDYFFYITVGPEGCLYVFPPETFAQISTEMEKDTGSFLNPNQNKKVYTKTMALTQQCHCDPQGRLVIPKQHLEAAKINTKAKIVGLRDRIQVWNPDSFENYIKDMEMSSGNQ